jgi:hypothetical protein
LKGKEITKMVDFIDLIRIGKDDPEYLKSVLEDKEKVAKFELTSAELEVLRKLDPNTIKVIVDSLEEKLRIRPVASSQACTGGTNACTARKSSAIPTMTPELSIPM